VKFAELRRAKSLIEYEYNGMTIVDNGFTFVIPEISSVVASLGDAMAQIDRAWGVTNCN
jgi:hypothetical protein